MEGEREREREEDRKMRVTSRVTTSFYIQLIFVYSVAGAL